MGIPLYLAMTRAEMQESSGLPPHLGYMSCLFSVYSSGLTNLPQSLPEAAILILSDQIPMSGHDPDIVLRQLNDVITQSKAESVLLDFQRPGNKEADRLVQTILSNIQIPVAVTPQYHTKNAIAFLPPIPPELRAEEYLAPFQGQEIWLETALQCRNVTVTEQESVFDPLCPAPQEQGLTEEGLCSYRISETEDGFRFSLFDTQETVIKKLEIASAFGVTRAVGLYQELQKPLC